jgi:hypothetical protein
MKILMYMEGIKSLILTRISRFCTSHNSNLDTGWRNVVSFMLWVLYPCAKSSWYPSNCVGGFVGPTVSLNTPEERKISIPARDQAIHRLSIM